MPSGLTLLSAAIRTGAVRALGEGDLLVAAQMLSGENQERELKPRLVEIMPHRVVEGGELHARHYGAKGGDSEAGYQCACHGCPPVDFDRLALLRGSNKTIEPTPD